MSVIQLENFHHRKPPEVPQVMANITPFVLVNRDRTLFFQSEQLLFLGRGLLGLAATQAKFSHQALREADTQ